MAALTFDGPPPKSNVVTFDGPPPAPAQAPAAAPKVTTNLAEDKNAANERLWANIKPAQMGPLDTSGKLQMAARDPNLPIGAQILAATGAVGLNAAQAPFNVFQEQAQRIRQGDPLTPQDAGDVLQTAGMSGLREAPGGAAGIPKPEVAPRVEPVPPAIPQRPVIETPGARASRVGGEAVAKVADRTQRGPVTFDEPPKVDLSRIKGGVPGWFAGLSDDEKRYAVQAWHDPVGWRKEVKDQYEGNTRARAEGTSAVERELSQPVQFGDYAEWQKAFSTPEAKWGQANQDYVLRQHMAEHGFKNFWNNPNKPAPQKSDFFPNEPKKTAAPFVPPAPPKGGYKTEAQAVAAANAPKPVKVKTAKGPKAPKISATIPPGTPSHVASLIKKGNNFFADQVAKQAEPNTLPMDEASRAKRAKALGFNTNLTLYHGTNKDFLQFETEYGKNGEHAIFVSDKPGISASYGGGKVLALWGKFQNPLKVDWKQKTGKTSYSNSSMKALIAEAKAAGHDSIVIKNIHDIGGNQTQYVFLKPENLRSKDAAAFNPAKKHSANLLSAAATIDPNAPPPVANLPDKTMKATSRELSDELHKLSREQDAVKREALNEVHELPPEAVSLKEKFFHYLEPGPGKPTLTKEEKAIFDKYLRPWIDKQRDLYEYIRKNAPTLLQGEFDPDYVHHLVKGKTPEFDEPLGEVTNEGTYPYMGGQKLPRTTRSLKNSRYYVIEDGKGNRRLVSLDDKGNMYLVERKQFLNVPPKDINGEVKPGGTFDIGGKEYTLKRASVAEKEAHTGNQYYKDAYAATIGNVVRLDKVAGALYFFEKMKSDPEFLKGAWRPGDNRPIPPEAQGTTLPGWEGWRFDPRIREVMDDWHNKPGEPWYENLANLNHAVLGGLFMLPFRHMGNVGAHWYVGRGWDWLSVPGYVRMAKHTTAAFYDVLKQGPMTRQMLRQGSAMMLPRVLNQDFYGQMLKALGEDFRNNRTGWRFLWDKLNVKEEDIYNGWLKASSAAMWGFNDVLMQSRVRELMESKKLPLDAAIKEAEKDIPNYRIHSRVMMDNNAGRAVSRYLQSSMMSSFGRYNNNKWRTIADMVTDIVKGNRKDRAEAVGKALALASLVYFLSWPLTAAIQAMTGKKNTQASPVGPASPVDDAKRIIELLDPRILQKMGATPENVQGTQLFQSMISMSPILDEAITQATGHNPYTNQAVQTSGERVQSLADKYSPAQIGMDVASGQYSPTEELLRSTIGERHTLRPPPVFVQKQREREIERNKRKQPVNKALSGFERSLKGFSPSGMVDWLKQELGP